MKNRLIEIQQKLQGLSRWSESHRSGDLSGVVFDAFLPSRHHPRSVLSILCLIPIGWSALAESRSVCRFETSEPPRVRLVARWLIVVDDFGRANVTTVLSFRAFLTFRQVLVTHCLRLQVLQLSNTGWLGRSSNHEWLQQLTNVIEIAKPHWNGCDDSSCWN